MKYRLVKLLYYYGYFRVVLVKFSTEYTYELWEKMQTDPVVVVCDDVPESVVDYLNVDDDNRFDMAEPPEEDDDDSY